MIKDGRNKYKILKNKIFSYGEIPLEDQTFVTSYKGTGTGWVRNERIFLSCTKQKIKL